MAMVSIFRQTLFKVTKTKNYCAKNHFHLTAQLSDEGNNIKKTLFVPFQKERPKKTRKVSVIGAAGKVGIATAYTLFWRNFCDKIVMCDIPNQKNRLCGETLDMLHATPWTPFPHLKVCLDMEESHDSNVIIVCGGVPRKPGQSRLDIAQTNIDVFKAIIPTLAKLSPDCVMIIATNPVDIMTYAAWKYSCFDKNRIIGTGTSIDSARFRYLVAKRFGICPRSLHGVIIGEHGDSSVPVWSSLNVAGTKLREVDPNMGTEEDENCWNDVYIEMRDSGNTLNVLKGFTSWGIACMTSHLAHAIIRNSASVHCVSSLAKGMHGIDMDVFLSLPAVLGNRGVRSIVQQVLCDDEIEKFQKSACTLYEKMQTLNF